MAFGQNINMGRQFRGQNLQQASQGMDLSQDRYRRGLFGPAMTFGNLFQSGEAQAYFNQEGIARGALQESLRAGQANVGRQGLEMADRQGLGPGFAAQIATNARQDFSGMVAQGVAAAKIADLRNRFGAASQIADALVTAQRGAFTRNLQRRASKVNYGETFGTAFMSNFGASLGGLLGNPLDDLAGMAGAGMI